MLEKFVHRLETIEKDTKHSFQTPFIPQRSVWDPVLSFTSKRFESKLMAAEFHQSTPRKKKKRERKKKAEISKERGLEFNTGSSIPRD